MAEFKVSQTPKIGTNKLISNNNQLFIHTQDNRSEYQRNKGNSEINSNTSNTASGTVLFSGINYKITNLQSH